MSDSAEKSLIPLSDSERSLGRLQRSFTRLRLTLTIPGLEAAATIVVAFGLYAVSGSEFGRLPVDYVLGAFAIALICNSRFSEARLYDTEFFAH